MASEQRQSSLAGTGHYLPDQVIENQELEERFDVPDGWIASRTGIRERRMVDDEETTGTMAVRAGQEALQSAGVDPDQVGLTLLATSTPDKPLPPTAPSVQHELGVSGGAFDIAGSCVGFLDALSTGVQYVSGDTLEAVLVIAANHLTYRVNWNDRETACLFGDGAGAVVLTTPEADSSRGEDLTLSVRDVMLGSDGSVSSLEVPAGGSKEPFTPEAWEEGRHLMRMQDGQDVFKRAVQYQVEVGRSLLERTGTAPGEIDRFLPHQANLKIMQSVRRKLGLPDDALLSNIDRCGNTSAASIPILLDQARRGGRFRAGDRILSTAFGCGLRFGAALITCE